MIEGKVPLQLRDVEFRRRYDLFYVKRRKGFYDVLVGVDLKCVGSLTHSYGEWVFCPSVGDAGSSFGNTRSEAVWDWLCTVSTNARKA